MVLQPYGSLFFAAAPVFASGLPEVVADSHNSVVILRLRGRTDLDTTFMEVLLRYAESLAAVDSKLAIVSASDRIREQLRLAGVTALIGEQSIYIGDERVGAAVKRANGEALKWIASPRHVRTKQRAVAPQSSVGRLSGDAWLVGKLLVQKVHQLGPGPQLDAQYTLDPILQKVGWTRFRNGARGVLNLRI